MKKILLLISIIIGVVATITVAAYDVSLNPSDTFQVLECNNEDGNHQLFQATVNTDRDSTINVVIYCERTFSGTSVSGMIIAEDYNGWPVGNQPFEAWPGMFNGSGRKEFSQKPDNWPYSWRIEIQYTYPSSGYTADAYFIWRTAF